MLWLGYSQAWLEVFGHLPFPYRWVDPLDWMGSVKEDARSMAAEGLLPVMPCPRVGLPLADPV